MTARFSRGCFGEPSLALAGLSVWVHGRQFPEVEDYDDGNWLRVTVYCGASGSEVWTNGAILTTIDIAAFGEQCAAMFGGDTGVAELAPCEPELKVSLEVTDSIGHIRALVELTPDHLRQSHRFEFEVDQSYLPSIIKQCAEIVREYPIRGQR